MNFTADQIRAINSQMGESWDVSAPRVVLLATAALMGEESTVALICQSQSHPNSTTWHVVCMLDSGCLFTIDAVGNESEWSYRSPHDESGRVEVELSTRIRSLSDVTSLSLIGVDGFGQLDTHSPWDVVTSWEVSWRDGSRALKLPTRTNPNQSERDAVDAIIEKVRQVLAAW